MRNTIQHAAGFLALPIAIGVCFASLKSIDITNKHLAYSSCIQTQQLNFPTTTTAEARNLCAFELK